MKCKSQLLQGFKSTDMLEAPRATPYGLARLPKIYLQERYQVFAFLIFENI
jgi:hypothetical protein